MSRCRSCRDALSDPQSISTGSLAWTVGLLEGEGTFTFKNPRSPVIRVVMTDLDVIEHLADATSVGRVVEIGRRAEHHKRAWAWTVQAREHLAWLIPQLAPLLHARRRAALNRQTEALSLTMPPQRTLENEERWPWIAGLLEGEMCMPRKKSGRVCGISTLSTDLDVLEDARAAADGLGFIYQVPARRPTHAPSYRWDLGAIAEIIYVLSSVRPHLLSRRGERADEVLADLASRTPRKVLGSNQCATIAATSV